MSIVLPTGVRSDRINQTGDFNEVRFRVELLAEVILRLGLQVRARLFLSVDLRSFLGEFPSPFESL